MFSSAEKTTHTITTVQQKALQQTFFRKAEEDVFFGANESTSFFGTPVQTKLSVSSPDDPQEKEADEVAETVMRMPDPIQTSISGNSEEKIDKKEDEEETVQAKTESNILQKISRKEDEEEVQAKHIEISRKEDEEQVQAKHISTDIIQRSGRGPPNQSVSFEKNLSSSKGSGSALPDNTKDFMESRFNADFSGIRIHTGAAAQSMNTNIHAQAFAHGNDIYFNEGKFSPHTEAGKTLLAHELTHTMQQGASPAIAPASVATKPVAQNNKLQRSTQNPPTPASTITGTNNITDSINLSESEGEDARSNGSKNDEDMEIQRSEVQSEPDLSHWHIDKSGVLQTPTSSIQKTEEDKELKRKEDEQKEEVEELTSDTITSIQKKNAVSSLAINTSIYQNSLSKSSNNSIQSKQQYENSSLTNTNHVLSTESESVRERGPPIQLKSDDAAIIHRSVIDDALAYTSVGTLLGCVQITDLDATSACLLQKAKEVAMHIPAYSALRVVLGSDPITGEGVERNGHNFIEAAFDIIPDGSLLYQKLEEQHQLEAAAIWIDGKMVALDHIVNGLLSRFDQFWEGLSLTDFGSPMTVMRDGFGIILGFINRIIDFAVEAGLELLRMVKDFLLDVLVEFIKEKTNAYTLLTILLEEDPITKKPVARNGTNILNALLELGGPEGEIQRGQMKDTGTFAKVAAFIDEGIAVFENLYATIVKAFSTIWDSITIEALMEPEQTFLSIYNILAVPVGKVLDFAERVVAEILKLIKDVLFKRISAEAKKTRGYYLMTVIIGKDPFTKAVVPRSAENLIHGFMSLMDGGEEQFQQMKESGAIAKTVNKVNAAVDRLNMTLESVIQLFINLWDSFTFRDFIAPIPTFLRIIHKFGEPIGRLIAFVVEIVKIVVVAILQLMNFPFNLINNIIAKTMGAFQMIKKDPIGFLKNLLKAIKQGFVQFFDNIVTHLINGVMGWLMSELKEPGIPQLTDFSLKGVISWVLEVLGISMDKIWEKLAAHPRIGPEKVARLKGMINTLEGVWTFIKDVQERGIVAIWEKIQEQLTNLWNTVLDAVKSWVMQTIIAKVTVKLLGMLDPTGIMAVVNSCIAIYNAVQSFIKYMREMLEVLNSFVNGVADIAKGNVVTAATYLENTMGRSMPIVIGFLANQVGLGGVGKRVGEMIESVREMVDNAITWLVNKAVDTGMDLLDRAMVMGRSAVGAVVGWLGLRKSYTGITGNTHQMYFKGSGRDISLIIESTPTPIDIFLTNKLNEIDGSISMDEAEKQPLRDKISLATQRNLELNNLINPSDGIEAANIESLINQKMENIKNLLKELDVIEGAQVVPRAIFVPGFNNNKASVMDVKYLFNNSDNHEPGQPANMYAGTLSGAVPLLSSVGLRSIWVAYHIVNADLGGKAVDSNLIPTPRYINGEYYRAFEKPLKAIYDSNIPIWMMAIVNYGSDYPDFPIQFQATGGGMKFENGTWVFDSSKSIPAFRKFIDVPIPESVYINQIPSDSSDWYLIINLTPVSSPVLKIVKEKSKTVITSKVQIKALIDTHGASYGYSQGYRTNLKNRVDEASINFTP